MPELNLYCVEYSATQKCFNIETLTDAINNNRENIEKRMPVDYQIIGIHDTYEACDKAIKVFRERYNL